ncbi:Uncharacterised protein [Mycobacterium tuberculosis]|uniref:Uncharacterized protein n=1 Tax=Mycobacterium tuberculosis TaxID=1773 RepID=A0A0T9X4Z4_MYCTX|nr:Uncharacterised protein [Mycobacterium tuberculosis]CFR77083.1 Uncharacterised protein [Mycobacterium tuberculosis]CKT90412.1 Uncharacterised protein [Mycobacterium tuberculosis]CKU33351.1 Uncharacterised protein [Mycobacterium tuberculosis]CNU26960.1 Uncharacterised protein [Mycobacterium tuberculosis]
MRHQIRHECQKYRNEHVAEHQPVERQLERVEAEVPPELRIPNPKVTAVQEQLDPSPVALGDDAGQQADRRGDSDAD